jgi:hypothetical protein
MQPVDRSTRLRGAWSRGCAKRLGLTVPPNVLSITDEVIE